MKHVRITESTLVQLAVDKSYNWMRTLNPIRSQLAMGKRMVVTRSACCGKVTTDITPQTFKSVVSFASFRPEIARLKEQLKADKITVRVSGVSFSV